MSCKQIIDLNQIIWRCVRCFKMKEIRINWSIALKKSLQWIHHSSWTLVKFLQFPLYSIVVFVVECSVLYVVSFLCFKYPCSLKYICYICQTNFSFICIFFYYRSLILFPKTKDFIDKYIRQVHIHLFLIIMYKFICLIQDHWKHLLYRL